MLQVVLLSLSLTLSRGFNALDSGKRRYQIQSGPCSYTFLLPEQSCQNLHDPEQRDGPLDGDENLRLQQLENVMENNTQWILKLETYIQDSLRQDVVHLQQSAVQNHTATMMELGASLLSHSVEQSKKLSSVEAQVISQTTRLEKKLLENALSTNKLEKQVIVQSNEINKLSDKNSVLEKRVEQMEGQRQQEVQTLREEKQQLTALLLRQTAVIARLEQQLLRVSSNNSVLQNQQQELLDTVNSLIHTITVGAGEPRGAMMKDLPSTFVDCAAVFKAGNSQSGVYTLTVPESSQELPVFCDMESEGGGWTVIQRRFDGHVDFHRTWQEYKKGFGDASGEYWLGNEFVSKVTSLYKYKLRIELNDWEGNAGFSQYEQFSLDSEEHNYRILLKGYSGTAGKISSIGEPGSEFSTKDADNDKCVCKCSQLTTGGWWFDACGPSNLNGMYYQQGQNSNRFNGIKWYYWKGSGYSLKSTKMMIRPADFTRSL